MDFERNKHNVVVAATKLQFFNQLELYNWFLKKEYHYME